MDVATQTLDLLDDAEQADRRTSWQPPPPVCTSPVLAKYPKLVGSAAGGAVCG